MAEAIVSLPTSEVLFKDSRDVDERVQHEALSHETRRVGQTVGKRIPRRGQQQTRRAHPVSRQENGGRPVEVKLTASIHPLRTTRTAPLV